MADDRLAALVHHHIVAAKARLTEDMIAAGCDPRDGWRIIEELRHTIEGTEWWLRPVHIRHASPPIDAVVRIDPEGRLL